MIKYFDRIRILLIPLIDFEEFKAVVVEANLEWKELTRGVEDVAVAMGLRNLNKLLRLNKLCLKRHDQK